MRRLDPNLAKIEEMMAFRGESFEALAIGDSTTLEGVNPEVLEEKLGIESYNLATGGQSPLESEMVLRHYLSRNEKPRLVLLGVNVNIDGYASAMNPSIYLGLSPEHRAEYARKVREVSAAPLDRSYPLFNRVKAYRHRRAIEHLIKFAIQGEGRRPRFLRGHLALEVSSMPSLPPVHEVSDDSEELEGFLALCREEGIAVLAFEPPNHPGYSSGSLGREEKLAWVVQRAADDPNLEFRSFNDEGSLSYAKEEWVNLNHLNAAGARRFTEQQIVPYLASAGPTASRR